MKIISTKSITFGAIKIPRSNGTIQTITGDSEKQMTSDARFWAYVLSGIIVITETPKVSFYDADKSVDENRKSIVAHFDKSKSKASTGTVEQPKASTGAVDTTSTIKLPGA